MQEPSIDAVVLDLETTGLLKKTDKIIEVGALKIRGGEVVDTFSRLIDPGFPLSEAVSNLTGITRDMLAGQPQFTEVADELEAFLEDDILIGHSITTDFAFLKKAFVDAKPKGYVFAKKGIDTLRLSRVFLPADEKKTLSAACAHFGYTFKPHRAVEDARANWFLFQKLSEQFGEKEPGLFEPKELVFSVKRDTPIMKKQMEQLQRLLTEKDLELPVPPESLTKSRASRIIDRIRNGETKDLLG
ncbi:MAG: 3'-5' exonuclease [Lachnospiraceae bacterium]|nr:3'-5' exonuclease [Lachnospiraceae bacterium]